MASKQSEYGGRFCGRRVPWCNGSLVKLNVGRRPRCRFPPPSRTAGSRRRPPAGYETCTWEPLPHLNHGFHVSGTLKKRTVTSRRSLVPFQRFSPAFPPDFRSHLASPRAPDCGHPRQVNRRRSGSWVVQGPPPSRQTRGITSIRRSRTAHR